MIARSRIAGCLVVFFAVAASAGAQVPPTGVSARVLQAQPAQPLERIVSLHLSDARLETALKEIGRQGGFLVEYTPRVVPVDKRVTVSLDSVTAAAAFETVLAGTGAQAVPTRTGNVMLVTSRSALPDTGTGSVSGRVVDSVSGRGVDKAAVTIEGSAVGQVLGTVTGDSGFYVIRDVPAGVRMILVRRIGYVGTAQAVVVQPGEFTQANVFLHASATNLNAIVVTATGPRRRLDVANDVTIINADSMVRVLPIANVTQLLKEAQVPGLEILPSSGTPGDPSRLRLRGAGSALSSNDPVIIVDGVRVYSAVSDTQSTNLALGTPGSPRSSGIQYAVNSIQDLPVPSPLDQIDPNTIATIEVFKGPSAATMYGPDAANGVIVITTKKGEVGPARWNVGVTAGLNSLPGQYPQGVYRWGTDIFGESVICFLGAPCTQDSIVRFQALNNPKYTILGSGHTNQSSLGVSGGVSGLTYALNGSVDHETGLLTLPAIQATQYQQIHGVSPPSWMQRPDQLRKWSGTGRLSGRLNDRINFELFATLTRETQERSNLETELTAVMTTYVDPLTGTYFNGGPLPAVGFSGLNQQSALVPDFYRRATDEATNLTNGASLDWRATTWLTVTADAGLNDISRHDQILTPRGALALSDSGGQLSDAHGAQLTSTINLRALATAPLPLGLHLRFAAGANYVRTSISDLQVGVKDLLPGTTSLNGAGTLLTPSQFSSDVRSLGWYLEPTFVSQRFSLSTGIRLDGSTSFGTHVTLPSFPKIGTSYLVSDEPWFPFKNVVNVLRLRAAYGRAGVWPTAQEQLRLYQSNVVWLDSSLVNATTVTSLGNTQLRPERSSEWEGGVDTDLLNARLSVALTAYRKMRYDAIMPVPIPLSVYGSQNIERNIGTIRNTGFELLVSAQIARSAPLSWSASMSLSSNQNLVVSLGPGVFPFGSTNGTRVAGGYPLNGYWARPIIGFYDANHDGIIEPSEVQIGDTAVYLGATDPRYQAGFATQVSLFHGTMTVNANFSYLDGLTQIPQWITGAAGAYFYPGLTDPNASLSQQAAGASLRPLSGPGTIAGFVQRVNILRFEGLSVGFQAPSEVARLVGAQALSIMVQGTNLGLWTNYIGKDPSVSAYTTGNTIADTGVLPTPRAWFLSIRAAY